MLLGQGVDASAVQLGQSMMVRDAVGNFEQAQASLTPLTASGYQPTTTNARWLATGINQDGQLEVVTLEVYEENGNTYLRQLDSRTLDGYGPFVGDTGSEANRVYNSMALSNDLRLRAPQWEVQRGEDPIDPGIVAAESMPGKVGDVTQLGRLQAQGSFSGLVADLPLHLLPERNETVMGVVAGASAVAIGFATLMFAIRRRDHEGEPLAEPLSQEATLLEGSGTE